MPAESSASRLYFVGYHFIAYSVGYTNVFVGGEGETTKVIDENCYRFYLD
jgi:hypothetical protein